MMFGEILSIQEYFLLAYSCKEAFVTQFVGTYQVVKYSFSRNSNGRWLMDMKSKNTLFLVYRNICERPVSIYIKEEAIFCVTKGFLTRRRTHSKLCMYIQDNLVVVIMSHFKPNTLVLMIKTRKKNFYRKVAYRAMLVKRT